MHPTDHPLRLALVACLLSAVVWPPSAGAAAKLRLTASPATVQPGGKVTVRLRGGGGASCKLTVQLDRRGAPVRLRRRIRTSLRLSIAPSTAPGRRVVRVRCGRRSAAARFTVRAPRSGPAPFTGTRLFFVADSAIASLPVADPAAIVTHVATPGATVVGLDASPSRLVWTEGFATERGVFTSSLDGSLPHQVHDSGEVEPTDGVLVGNVYFWLEGDAIARADLGTGAVNPRFIPLPPSDFDGLGPADGLASDGRWLYFATCGNDAIGRVDLGGAQLDKYFVRVGYCVQDVAVNATHVYWPNLALADEQAELGRAAIDGSAIEAHWLTTPGGGELGNYGVAADATHVYWTSSDSNAGGGRGYIGRVRTDGSDLRPKLVTRDNLGLALSIAP